jgi:hypothetical protein
LRGSLNELAREYNLSVTWDSSAIYQDDNRNYPDKSDYRSLLTGTYQLDFSRSDSPSEAAQRAVSTLPQSERDSAQRTLEQRLEAPERIAIEQRGRQITIASSRAPRFSFEADGRDKFETADNGTQLRVRATQAGDRLEIQTSGAARGNDYIVTFEPQRNGELRIERRLSADFLRQPVVVQSFYKKNSDVAQLDIYEQPNNLPDNTTTGTTNRSSNDYVVSNGTVLSAT